jgi:hypothetical protein
VATNDGRDASISLDFTSGKKNMKKLAFCLVFAVSCAAFAYSQPRIVEKPKEQKTPPAISQITFKVKYEGGMFGFTRKEEGILKFDDANFRLVFFSNDNKERFAIPYKSIIVIYPNTRSVQSTGGKVVQHVPLPGAGIAGMFMKDKKRYMVVNFDDPDISARGAINFKLESREQLERVIQTLGDKAEMQQRGDSYFRPQKSLNSIQ